MSNLFENSDLTSIWQLGGSAAAEQANATLPSAAAALSLNITYLPAPDQSRIWTFLEFIHEYSRTAWRLQSGENDADIWFVDGAHDFLPPTGVRREPTVVHVVRDMRQVPRTADGNFLVRPLDMENFVLMLQRLEKNIARSAR